MRLLYDNIIDRNETLLTASSESGTYPVLRIKDSLRKRRWRATGAISEYIIAQLPPNETICCFAITGHNLSETAVITIARSQNGSSYTTLASIRITPQESVGFGEGFFGYGGFGGVTLSTILPGSTQYAFFSAVSSTDWPYWKITIADPDNADGLIEIGRVFLGSHWQPTYQIIPGWNINVIDDSEILELVSGQKINNPKSTYLQAEIRLPHLGPSDAMSEFLAIVRDYKATKKDVFLVLFPTTGSQFLKDVTTLYGRFLGGSGIGVSQIGFRTFDTGQLIFEESL